jgi:molecular chaperone IbpA
MKGIAFGDSETIESCFRKEAQMTIENAIKLNTKNALWDLEFPPRSSAIGFDRIMEKWRETINAVASSMDGKYPPYNILTTGEYSYCIEIALAGFSREDINITQDNRLLTVEGSIEPKEGESKSYLHRGIAERSFSRTWTLAEHVSVVGAKMENGILRIDLIHEIPEDEKPKKIDIK